MSEPGLSLTDQPPIDAAATVLDPPPAPTETWHALADPRDQHLPFVLQEIVRDLTGDADDLDDARRILVEDHDVTALATDGPTGTAYHYAQEAVKANYPQSDPRFWSAATLHRELGRGQPRGVRSRRTDIATGPQRLLDAALDAGRDAPIVALGLPEEFWAATREQRETWLLFVRDRAEVLDVRLACSTLDRAKLWREHRDLLPADVRADAKPGRSGGPIDEQHEERAQAALAALDVDSPLWVVLRVLVDEPAQEALYHRLYTDPRLTVSNSAIRHRVDRLAELDLVATIRDGRSKRVLLEPAGEVALQVRAAHVPGHDVADALPDGLSDVPDDLLDAVDAETAGNEVSDRNHGGNGCTKTRFSGVSDPEQYVTDVFTAPTCEEPVNPLRRCRVTPHASTGGPEGAAGGAGPAGRGRDALPDAEWLSYAAHHGAAAAAPSGGIALDDRPVESRDDPRPASVSFDESRDELVVSVEADGPLATAVRLCVALTSDRVFGSVLTPDRLDGGRPFAGLVEDNPYILRRTRCLGYLKDEDAGATAYCRRLRAAREDLLELAGDVRDADGDYNAGVASQVLRDAHGLAATVTQLLDLAGVNLVREIRLPEYSRNIHDKRHTMLKWLSRAVALSSRKGHYSAFRVLYEDREDKREQILGAPTCHDPTGDHIGSWTLVGPGVSKLAPDLEGDLEHDLARQEDGENYAEFAVDVPVADADRRDAVRDAVERAADATGLRPTREAVATLHATTGSPQAVLDALLRLGGQADDERDRDLDRFELRYALAHLDADRLLPDLPRSVGKILAALLNADEPLTQGELADAAGVSGQSVREYDGLLEALGLVDVERGSNGAAHAYRLRLPFRDERRSDGEPRPLLAPDTSQPPGAAPDPDLYYRWYHRPDEGTVDCWRPAAAVYYFRSAVGRPVSSSYRELWDALLAGEHDLVDVVPDDLAEWVEVARRLIGADTDRSLPGPLATTTGIGARGTPEQVTLETALAD